MSTEQNSLVIARAAAMMGSAALLNAEVASMVAFNQHRLSLDQSIGYNEDAFYQVISRYDAFLGVDAVARMIEGKP